MPQSWREVKEIVEEWREDGKGEWSVRHYKNKILDILQAAEDMGIEPLFEDTRGKTKLREIVGEADKAIKKGDKDRLRELLIMARDWKTAELRNEFRQTKRPKIEAKEIVKHRRNLIRLDLTEQQFNCIVKHVDFIFEFVKTSNSAGDLKKIT